MHSTIDIGMLRGLITHQTVDDWLRHLAGCRIIEKDQGFTVDLELENRKISANFLNIKHQVEL
jgi:hypothetical protein